MQKTKYFHDILIPLGVGVGKPLKTENKLMPQKKKQGNTVTATSREDTV